MSFYNSITRQGSATLGRVLLPVSEEVRLRVRQALTLMSAIATGTVEDVLPIVYDTDVILFQTQST